jgi:P4 family phage/plasmid primase-like protien
MSATTDNNVTSLLKKHYAVSNAKGTHVSMVHPKGNFRLSNKDICKLWDMFCCMSDAERAGLGVAEVSDDFMPILADVDLKINEEELSDDMLGGEGKVNHDNLSRADYPTRYLYTIEEVEALIGIYQSIIKEIVDNCSDKMLTCVLLEKPMYKKVSGDTTYVKNGFHLHFPYVFLRKSDQSVHLIPRIHEKVAEANLFGHMGLSDPSVVIDNAILKNPWLMYGCKKEGVNMAPYKVTEVYDCDLHICDLEETFENYRIYDINEDEIPVKGSVLNLLPRILSIVPCNRKTATLKMNLVAPFFARAAAAPTVLLNEPVEFAELDTDKNMATAKDLLPMLSTRRSVDYNLWMQIGFILYNVSGGTRDGYNLWDEFSRRGGDSYDETGCIHRWQGMKRRLTPGIGSLIYYAKQDSPQAHAEYQNNIMKAKVSDSINTGGAHNDIAKMLYDRYNMEFKCASVSNKKWYQFRNHIWEEIEEGTFLRAKISSKDGILGSFMEEIKRNKELCGAEPDKAVQKTYECRIDGLEKIANNLKSAPNKNNIMREAVEVFYDRNFEKKLDQNKYMVAFQNGVYNLKTHHFRPGRPEDYVSTAVPINYNDELNFDHESVQNVLTFLEQVFPDKSVRRYFMDVYADIFVGGNSRKIVLFWTGDGDNGKSVTQKLLEKMLGPLAIKFETTLLSGKKVNLGGASPELARAGPPVRHAVLEEPNKAEQLNCGVLKKLSGSDSYFARDLFQKGKGLCEIDPFFTLTFICNALPGLRDSDKATWNRIRVIPFESTFVKPGFPCPESYEEQLKEKRFPMDQKFEDKIPGMLEGLAWVLLNHRKTTTPIPDPEKVKEATRVYQKQNDKFEQFANEMIEKDPDSIVTANEVWDEFRDWHKMNFPSAVFGLSMQEFTKHYEKVWGVPDNDKRYTGIRIKTFNSGQL